jgi:hypothetical protein
MVGAINGLIEDEKDAEEETERSNGRDGDDERSVSRAQPTSNISIFRILA